MTIKIPNVRVLAIVRGREPSLPVDVVAGAVLAGGFLLLVLVTGMSPVAAAMVAVVAGVIAGVAWLRHLIDGPIRHRDLPRGRS